MDLALQISKKNLKFETLEVGGKDKKIRLSVRKNYQKLLTFGNFCSIINMVKKGNVIYCYI